jgi:hypothetical protein
MVTNRRLRVASIDAVERPAADFGGRQRRLQRRPEKGKVDALVRPGMALHCRANGRRRHFEQHARHRDRERRRIERNRRARPGWPQHVSDESSGREQGRDQERERQQQKAGGFAARFLRESGLGRHDFPAKFPACQLARIKLQYRTSGAGKCGRLPPAALTFP